MSLSHTTVSTTDSPGQRFSDRVFIPVSGFMKHYADELTPVPFAPVRRLSGGDPLSSRTPSTAARGRGARKGKPQEEGNTDSAEVKKLGGKTRKPQREESDADAGDTTDQTPRDEGKQQGAKISVTGLKDGSGSEEALETGLSSVEQDDLTTGTSPARLFLPDLQKPISPELSGKFLDVYFPQKGQLDPPRVCQALGIKKGGPPHGCDKENYRYGRAEGSAPLSS